MTYLSPFSFGNSKGGWITKYQSGQRGIRLQHKQKHQSKYKWEGRLHTQGKYLLKHIINSEIHHLAVLSFLDSYHFVGQISPTHSKSHVLAADPRSTQMLNSLKF